MRISLRAFGLLSDYTKPLGGEAVETAASDLRALFDQLSIPEELVMLATVNGEASDFDRTLAEGDRVILVPPVAGG